MNITEVPPHPHNIFAQFKKSEITKITIIFYRRILQNMTSETVKSTRNLKANTYLLVNHYSMYYSFNFQANIKQVNSSITRNNKELKQLQ